MDGDDTEASSSSCGQSTGLLQLYPPADCDDLRFDEEDGLVYNREDVAVGVIYDSDVECAQPEFVKCGNLPYIFRPRRYDGGDESEDSDDDLSMRIFFPTMGWM